MSKTQCLLAFVALFMGLAHSWEIAISKGDELEFYINDIKTDTVRLDSQNPTTLAYDEVHDMLLYVDKQSGNDSICGYNIPFVEYKCYIKNSGRDIHGLAFDPITQHIFFTDTKERSVNWLSLEPGSKNDVYGNLLIKLEEGIPTDIAVDSCRGYIYWINTNLTTPTIERVRFNGSNREVVINTPYKMVFHSLAIGQQTQRIYWIITENNLKSHLYSTELNGMNVKNSVTFMTNKAMLEKHPNLITLLKKDIVVMSWCADCTSKHVWKVHKPSLIPSNYTNYLDIHAKGEVGITANYKIRDQFDGVQQCQSLSSLSPQNSLKIAREYEGPFCVHGVKVIGQSVCDCSPGYTGERCDVHVCENYCLHGTCIINDQGLPKCRCNDSFNGDRCEAKVFNEDDLCERCQLGSNFR